VIKKSALAVVALMLAAAPQMFGAEEITLIATGTSYGTVTCTFTLVGGVPTPSGDCTNLQAIVINPDNGTFQVIQNGNNTWDGTGLKINVTGQGGDATTFPTLQNLNQIQVESVTGDTSTLEVLFSADNYPVSGATFNVADSITIDQAISTSSVTFEGLVDSSNLIPALDSFYSNTLTGHSNSNGVNGVDSPNPDCCTVPYSLTSHTTIQFAGVGTVQANMTISTTASVPEPASIFLLGTMLLTGTMVIRRKAKKA